MSQDSSFYVMACAHMKPRNKQSRNHIIFLRCIASNPDLFPTRFSCQATQIGVSRSVRPWEEGKDWCINSSTSLDQLIMVVKLQPQHIIPSHWNGFNPWLLWPCPSYSPGNLKPPVSPFKAITWQKNDSEKKKVYFQFSLSCLFSTATHFSCSENTNYLCFIFRAWFDPCAWHAGALCAHCCNRSRWERPSGKPGLRGLKIGTPK